MKKMMMSIFGVAAWLWRHVSAGVAVALMVGALFVGYRLGRPAGQPTPEVVAGEHEHAGDDAIETAYTCSMHPAVRLPDADAKCPICFMDLIPVAADAGGAGSALRLTLSESAVAMSRIETAEVGRFYPTGEVRLFGKVGYDETTVARISAYFPGRIERLMVNYVGASVEAGDALGEVYSPDLLAAFEELRQVRLAHDRSGGMSELVRQTTRNTLEAARDKLRLYGLSSAQIAAGEAGPGSDRLTITAPIGGVVTHLLAREGEYIQTGGAIATVADLSRLWVQLGAYESQLPMLGVGTLVSFTAEAQPGVVFEGEVAFVEPAVDVRTRTAAVRVEVENADGRLMPGMFVSAVARVRIGADGAIADGDSPDSEPPLVVPRSSVLYTGTRSVVYVAVAGAERPTYEGREVVLGARAGDFYIVKEGLREGESVVVHGAFRIDSAMQIMAKPSMMSMGTDDVDTGLVMDVPDGFVDSLTPVYEAYLDVQGRLAGDDFDGFLRAAGELAAAVEGVREVGVIGEPLGVWRRAAAQLGGDLPAGDITAARARFESMSGAVVSLERAFGHAGSQTWRLATCPMAFDFKGAEWLQRGETINNPYFGAEMPRCGDFTDSFEPRDDLRVMPASEPMDMGHGHE